MEKTIPGLYPDVLGDKQARPQTYRSPYVAERGDDMTPSLKQQLLVIYKHHAKYPDRQDAGEAFIRQVDKALKDCSVEHVFKEYK